LRTALVLFIFLSENQMSIQPKRHITPEEYLEIECAAQFRSEYYGGEMFAMSGASAKHNILSVNLTSALHSRLRRTRCSVFVADVRLHVPLSGLFTYPDLIIACNPNYLEKQKDTLLNPSVLFEILSPSTEAYDRGEKFAFYRRIESLKQYVLVSQDVQRIERFSKNEHRSWVLTEYSENEASLEIELVEQSLSLDLPLREIYEGVFT
jgi:Uma2 family endonuclease